MNRLTNRIIKATVLLMLTMSMMLGENASVYAQSIPTRLFDSSGIRVGSGNKEKSYAEGKADFEITFDTVMEVDGVVIYDFEKDKSVGATTVPDVTINFEGYYGTTAHINKNNLSYHYYNYTDTASNTANVEIYKQGSKHPVLKVKNVGEEEHKLDLTKLSDGLYYILAKVIDDKQDNTTKQFFYVNGSDSYLCSVGGRIYDDVAGITRGKNNMANALKDINLEDCLDLSKLTYPTSGANGHVNHTKLWSEKGRSLVEEEWSDERKVFTFTQWLVKNIAYDHYKAYNGTRARLVSTDSYDGYADDKNFAYYNGVGVCWDYTNILNIMCRAQGIPATSLDTDNHTYSVVYIAGHWVPIDIVMFYAKECSGKDTSKISERSLRDQRFTNGYGTYSMVGMPKSVGKQMWTYENATDPNNAPVKKGGR